MTDADTVGAYGRRGRAARRTVDENTGAGAIGPWRAVYGRCRGMFEACACHGRRAAGAAFTGAGRGAKAIVTEGLGTPERNGGDGVGGLVVGGKGVRDKGISQ